MCIVCTYTQHLFLYCVCMCVRTTVRNWFSLHLSLKILNSGHQTWRQINAFACWDITTFPLRHLMGTRWVVLPLQKVFTWLSWVESQESSLPWAHLTPVQASQPECASVSFSTPPSYWYFDLSILGMTCPLCFSFLPTYASKEQLRYPGYCFFPFWDLAMHLQLHWVWGLAGFLWVGKCFGGFLVHLVTFCLFSHAWFLDQVMNTVLFTARAIILCCSLTNEEQQGGRSPGRPCLLWWASPPLQSEPSPLSQGALWGLASTQ